MNDTMVDYCLSGSVPLSLELACRRFGEFGHKFDIHRVRIILENNSIEIDGSEYLKRISDSSFPLWSSVLRLEFTLHSRELNSNVHLWLFRDSKKEETTSVVDGMVYLDNIVEQSSHPTLAVQQLATFVASIAASLDADFLTMADEDNEYFRIGQGPYCVPSVFGIYKCSLLKSSDELALRSEGALFQQIDDSYLSIWVLPIQDFLNGALPPRSLIASLKMWLGGAFR